MRHGIHIIRKILQYTKESSKKKRQIFHAEPFSTCLCYRYVGHAWMEIIGREEDGFKVEMKIK